MAKNKLTALLDQQQTASSAAAPPITKKAARAPAPIRIVHKPGEVNISAYFNPEVKAALRHVQAKTGKSIKGCLAEALQLLFRKYNVAVTVSEE
jgi:hypothetical protein